MPGVYVYDFDDVDLDTTGRVGDLMPVECYFDEEKNGDSVLKMRLLYDKLNKWAAVKVGSYIKAMVPVRVPPKITSNTYDQEIMTYKVRSTVGAEAWVYVSSGYVRESISAPATKSLFYNIAVTGGGGEPKEVKVKRKIKPGTEVQILEMKDDGTCRVYAKGVGKGWTFLDNLEPVVESTIPATFDGVEAVVTPSRLEYQLFQVTAIEQTLDYMDVTAQHVFYELLHTFTNYKTQLPVPAFEAIDGVFGGMVVQDERFTCLTDTAQKAGALDYERKNVVQALLDPENGICAQYGLSLVRDNYDAYLLKEVGSDRGFVVEYSKNMLNVERTEDITDVVTRIIPMGRTKKGEPVFLDGVIWVDSPRIEDYSFPRTMYLDCSDTATESDTMTLAQVKENLRERAQAEFDAGCDVPALEMTVDFISLGDTEEFRQYRDLDKVYLFDKITVRDRVRGYDYTAEVVKIRHNVLTGLLESVSLGSLQKGNGKRKIATWQVPEVDGGNIRLASIVPGVLAGGAVGEENLQTGAVSTRVIDAYAITTEKLAAGAITADKIGAGEITTDKLAAKSVTADKLDAEFVISDFIEAGSITTEMLAAGSVTADKLAAGAISADFIEAGSITADKMAAGVLSADLIGAHSITADKIATGAITAESGIIAAGAVGTAQIADGSITSAKIVNLSADVITSGTLATERLLIKGTDGIIYEINAQSSGLTAAELTKEQYKNQLNGTVIVAESITAAQLAAEAVTANKILAGAVTSDKIAANAVTADKIKAGAITTAKVSSDFEQSLDLSSNRSINMLVSGITKTYVQYEQPVGQFNVGDVWVKAQAPLKWSTMLSKTWEAAKADEWGGWAYTELPATHAWNGEKWVLTVDYNVVEDNSTSIRQTKDVITLKADKTTVDALNGRVVQNSSEIQQTAQRITLLVETSEGMKSQIDQQADSIKTLVTDGQGLKSQIQQQADSINTLVSNDAGMQSQINQQADKISTLVSNGQGMQSQIDQQADKISTLVSNGQGMQSQIDQQAGQIALKAGIDDPAKSVQTSTVTINTSGVKIKTGGTFTVDSQKFDIDESGEMSAVNARISGQLSVDGNDVWHKGNLIVSTATPNNPTPGMIWVKPDMTNIPAAGTWSHEALPARPWSNNYVVELSGTNIGEAPSGATYTYEVSVPVYYSHNKTGTCTCTVYLGATSGAKTISMGTQSFDANNAGGSTYKASVTSTTWLGNAEKIYMLVVFSNGNLMTVNSYEAFACTLMAKSASAAGWKACEVQMYVG